MSRGVTPIEVGQVWRVRRPDETRRTVLVELFDGSFVHAVTLTAVQEGGRTGHSTRIRAEVFRRTYEYLPADNV